jgi:hypothetical protein
MLQHSNKCPCSFAGRSPAGKYLFIDVHHMGPGKLTYEAVAKAHSKDLDIEGKYGVEFIKFWVDPARGIVYCLSSAPDTGSIVKTHTAAHGLLPDRFYLVTEGSEATSLCVLLKHRMLLR